MNWLEENKKDETLLLRLELKALDPATPGADEELAVAIDAYNQTQAGVLARFKNLADHRRGLAEPAAWLQCSGAELNDARATTRRESWDAVIELRRLVEIRDPLLHSLRQKVRDHLNDMGQRRRELVERTAKKMDPTRRQCVKANPYGGAGYFASLVESTEPVEAADREIGRVAKALAGLEEFYLNVIRSVAIVEARQEELFAATET